jgi:hypothetical protein
MIYLIQYDRRLGKVEALREFDESRRREAERLRLELELELNNKGLSREIVLLEAANKEALHRTHNRYFADLEDILRIGAVPAA